MCRRKNLPGDQGGTLQREGAGSAQVQPGEGASAVPVLLAPVLLAPGPGPVSEPVGGLKGGRFLKVPAKP